MDTLDLTRRHEVDGVALAWDRWGDGDEPALVLCHGFTGSSHDFAMHVPALAERGPVVVLDHRGHGASTTLGREDGYSTGRLVADMVSLLESATTEPVDLLGHSMGGYVSLRLTLERPDLVRSLVLMDTSPWSFRRDDPELAQMMEDYLDRFDPSGSMADVTPLETPETALIEAATTPGWRDRAAELGVRVDPYAFRALGLELTSRLEPLRDRLAEVAVPVTVLVGSLDEPFASQAPSLVEALPAAELVVFDGAYHSPQLTHPRQWLAAVVDHLDRARRR